MKEGLRSGSISAKAEKKVLAEREDEKKSCFVFNVEKSSKEDSSGFEHGNEVMESEKKDGLGSEECRGTALDGSTRKSSTVHGGQNGDCGIVYNRVKENCKVKNVGRVLRRRLGIKTGDEKESNKAEIVKKDRNMGCYGSENGRDVDVQVGVSSETIDAEGLRSNKVIPGTEDEVNDMKKISFHLNDEIVPMTGYGNDFVENNVEIKESVGSIIDEGGATGMDENERNSRVNGEDNGGDGVVIKSMKDDCKVKNVGRVLRSRIKSESKKETCKTEVEVKGRNRMFDGSENKGDIDGQITKTDFSPDFLKENIEIEESDGPINNEYGKSGLDENKRKRSRVDGEELGDDGAVRRRVKEDCEVRNVGRVLRPRLGIKSGCEKENNHSEIEKKNRNRVYDGSEDERDVDVQIEVGNEICDVDGMRSGIILVKPTDKVILENEVYVKKKYNFDLNVEMIPEMSSGSDSLNENIEINESDGPLNDECGETGVDENKRKRSRVDGEELRDDGVVKKKMKKDIDEKNFVSILRPRLGTNSVSDNESNKAGIEETDRNRPCNRSEIEMDVAMPIEASNETNCAEQRKKVKGKRGRPLKVRENDKPEDEQMKISKVKCGRMSSLNKIDESHKQGRRKVKGRRGRPRCKAQDTDESDAEKSKRLRSKLGRPRKGGFDDGGGKRLKKKRGRPRKVQVDEVLKGKVGKGKKVNGIIKGQLDSLVGGLKRDLPTYSLTPEKRPDGTELDMPTYGQKRPNIKNKCADTRAEDVEAMSKLTVKTNESEKKHVETNQEEIFGKRGVKQLLRDRIVELLLGAGWTIEYRPRYGREYSDAVYVNPEGNTHWSVTKAYRVLKNHYEQGGCKAGFKFTPIPEDELSILTRITTKTRSDKNKKKKGKNASTGGEMVTKKKKKKVKMNSAASLHGKSLKRGIKVRTSVSEICNSAGTLLTGTSIPARRPKLQESQNRKRCALLVRSSVEGAKSFGDDFVAYAGKRTVLAWMIDTGTLPLSEKVRYWNQKKTRVMLQGRIARDGIKCDCCDEMFTISNFATHSKSKLANPFQNLYLESGNTLMQCILDSWNKQDESICKAFHFVDFGGEDPNDDTCGICGDGGDLVCCDGCPSTFHQSCLDIKFPSGKWHCGYCTCKFCGRTDKNTDHMDDHNDSMVSTLQICSLCEEKYHQSCSQTEGAVEFEPPFCGKKCQEIFEKLKMLIGVKHELEEGYSWSLVHRSDVSDLSLSDVCQKVECNARLAVSLFVMDECFLPLPDHRSGVNLIHNIVYNFRSNFKRLDYKGFYTAILEKDDEIISAASIRIHGKELAEMPFIGTRHMYRRQGMCRRLLTGIEYVLCSLTVEKLVIPAISELRETWTSVFGFQPLEVSSKRKMRNMSLLVFPGVDLLQKPMLKNQFSEENMISAEGLKSSELEKPPTIYEVGKNSDEKCSDGFDLNACCEAPPVSKINNESAAGDSSLLFPIGSHDASGLTSETLNFLESTTDTNCNEKWSMTSNDVQGSDKTAMNPLDSVSDDQTEVADDCGGQFTHASSRAFKSIGSEVGIENGSVKQSLDEDQDVQQLPVIGCVESDKSKLDQNVYGSSDSRKQASSENFKAHVLCETSNTFSCTTDQASPSVIQGAQNVDSGIDSFCHANGLDECKSVSLVGSQIHDGFKISIQSSETLQSDSQVNQDVAANCNTEPFCNSSPGSGVASNCAYGGGNSHSAPEAIVLSNKAS